MKGKFPGKEKPIKFVCKWCKVEVLSRFDHRAVLGKTHKRCCPRRRLLG